MPAKEGARRLATVLFTDIVGSTQITSELGDAAWKALVRQHHDIVRRRLKRSGGHENDTAGDGFFATFDAPGAAIRCAVAIAEDVREISLEMRCGLHTGEERSRSIAAPPHPASEVGGVDSPWIPADGVVVKVDPATQRPEPLTDSIPGIRGVGFLRGGSRVDTLSTIRWIPGCSR
jgi:hypothetical protein